MKAKVPGIEYMNYRSQSMEARSKQASCQKHWFDGICEVCWANILDEGDTFEEKNQQDTFLQVLVIACTVKQWHTHKDGPESEDSNFIYFVKVCRKGTGVCKRALIATYSVTQMWIIL
jgi:hypothetical protein